MNYLGLSQTIPSKYLSIFKHRIHENTFLKDPNISEIDGIKHKTQFYSNLPTLLFPMDNLTFKFEYVFNVVTCQNSFTYGIIFKI